MDTWWQTETGMILISPLPGITATKPGSATRPLPGIVAEVVDADGKPVGPGGGGYLVLKQALAVDDAHRFTATPIATCRITGRAIPENISPATAARWTTTAISGCSAAWTT